MNPNSNNHNPEFNPFSYDPELLRNLLVQLQQNLNIQQFQQKNPNFRFPQQNPSVQPQPNFQAGFASYSQSGFQESLSQHRYESDFVSPNQLENEIMSETQDTQKRNKKGKKNKQSAGTGPSSGSMTPKQWTPDEESALGKCYMDESENKTKDNSQKR
ncbi:hypothetical protein R6Q57_011533 [Mikania cordata]